ncbi:MAG: hypothetical protein AAGB93_09420 [Planctomycetota bacterium]
MESTAATTAFVLAMDVVLAFTVLALLRSGGASRRTLTAAASVLWIGGLFALVQTESLFPADLSGIGLFAALLAGVGATAGFA